MPKRDPTTRAQPSPTARGRSTTFAAALEPEGAGSVLFLEGEIDLDCRPELQRALDAALEQRVSLVVDLGGVDYMDSTGLNALIRAAQEANALKVRFAVRGARPMVQRVFEIAGVKPLLMPDSDRSAG